MNDLRERFLCLRSIINLHLKTMGGKTKRPRIWQTTVLTLCWAVAWFYALVHHRWDNICCFPGSAQCTSCKLQTIERKGGKKAQSLSVIWKGYLESGLLKLNLIWGLVAKEKCSEEQLKSNHKWRSACLRKAPIIGPNLLQHILTVISRCEPPARKRRVTFGSVCLHEWRHSMMVVASMKYPPHRTHMRWGLSSVIFILVVRCILSERDNNAAWKTNKKRE